MNASSGSAPTGVKILVDGYNLLHASGLVPRGVGPGTLDRARRAMLKLLARALDRETAERTLVVFDAKESPAGRASRCRHHGIWVQYATGHQEADDLLEEYIAAHSSPRQLTVVSSDRRLKTAARRRRAQFADSDTWWEDLQRAKQAAPTPPDDGGEKPSEPLSEDEVARWMRRFADQ